MSELIQKHDNRATIRWKLLTGASALALTACVSSVELAKADDADSPAIWIELGGQLEMMQGLSAPFTAPFMTANTPTPGPYRGNVFDQSAPRYALGLDGKITFQPEGSDWSFSAGIRYGRSHTNRHVHNQTNFAPFHYTFLYYGNLYHIVNNAYNAPFADTKAPIGERHAILDFSAGKDIGLGMFGRESTSTVSAGVRFARESLGASLDIQARPFVVPHFSHAYWHSNMPKFFTWDQYSMTGHAARSFKGIGPSLSWEASAAIAGNPEHGEVMFDWSINAAALFGRQKAKTDHSTEHRHDNGFGHYPVYPVIYHHPSGASAYHSTRSRSVTVPNIGASIGISYRLDDAKLSVGYRYDTFLGAMDTGIDARKESNLTFNGPYASISIGLGD